MPFCRLLIFFKINFFEKFLQKYHLSVKQIGSRSGPMIGPDLGPICLQKLSAEDTWRQGVKNATGDLTQFRIKLIDFPD